MADTVLDGNYVPPMGPRFSQIYLARGTPTEDKPRLRNRVAAFFERILYDHAHASSDAIETRIGTDHSLSSYPSSVADYLRKCTASDFRDAITVIHWGLLKKFEKDRYTSVRDAALKWRTFCQEAFVEENVSYRVDDQCMVRPFVDDEFSSSAATVLRGLDDVRLSAVHAEVDHSISRLGGRQPDPKGAVRAIFEAIEIYMKLVITTGQVKRLNRNLVKEHLIPAIRDRAKLDPPAAAASVHIGESLGDWIDACHIYRHGQGVNSPTPPPHEVAVALVSGGLTHLRWLLDSVTLPQP